MEIVRLIWAVNLFFFCIILLFVWSRILVVTAKIKATTGIIAEIEEITGPSSEM